MPRANAEGIPIIKLLLLFQLQQILLHLHAIGVAGELVDALGEDSDLDLGGTGVGLVGAVGLDDGGLLIVQQHSCVSTFLLLRPHP